MNNLDHLSYLKENQSLPGSIIENLMELVKRVYLRNPSAGIPYALCLGIHNVNRAVISFVDSHGNEYKPPKDYFRFTLSNKNSNTSYAIMYDFFTPEGVE